MSGVGVLPLRGVGLGTFDARAEEHSSEVVGHVSTTLCAQNQYRRFVRKCLVMIGGQRALRRIPSSSTPSSSFSRFVSCDTCVWFCCVVRVGVCRWIVCGSGSRRVLSV